MSRHDDACDAQSQPVSAGLGFPGLIAAVEAVEHLGQIFGRNACAGVGHAQVAAAAVAPYPQRDAAARGRVLDGIVHQYAHELLDHALVGTDAGILRGIQFKAMRRRKEPCLPVDLAHHLQGVKYLHFQHERLFVVPGQKQQAFHQLLHAGGLLRDGADALVQHGLVGLAPAFQHAPHSPG